MALLVPVVLPLPFESNPANTPIDPGFVASDSGGGDLIPLTGREIVLVNNTDVGAQTITVTSQPAASTQRLGDITAASVPAGAIRAFQLFPTNGWVNSNGQLEVQTSNNLLQIAILRLR